MRSNTIIALLCLACVANASLFDVVSHVSSNTRLRGKLGVTTDNGFKLSYNGTLGFDNGKVSVDIADVGAAFQAKTRNTTQDANGFGGIVDYAGNLAVNQSGRVADIGVAGTASASGNGNHTTEDNITNVNYNFKVQHLNGFNATYGDYAVLGGQFVRLDSRGNVQIDGTSAKTTQKTNLLASLASNITHGSETIGHLVAARTLNANVTSKTVLTGGQAAEVNVQGKQVVPEAITNGNTNFSTATFVEYNGQNQSTSSEGQAGFNSITWTKVKADANGTAVRAGVAENVDFTVAGKVFINGTQLAETLTVGDLAQVRGVESRVDNNGTWGSRVGSTGTLNAWTLGQTVGNSTESAVKKFMSKFKTTWGQGAEAKGARNDDDTATTEFKAGGSYKVEGYDSITQKSWDYETQKGVAGVYNATANPNQPGDLTLYF